LKGGRRVWWVSCFFFSFLKKGFRKRKQEERKRERAGSGASARARAKKKKKKKKIQNPKRRTIVLLMFRTLSGCSAAAAEALAASRDTRVEPAAPASAPPTAPWTPSTALLVEFSGFATSASLRRPAAPVEESALQVAPSSGFLS